MPKVVRETSDTVYTAFRRLSAKDRAVVIEHLLDDKKFREDLLDIATIEQRRAEPSRPLRDYLASRKKE